ncbi:MAG TPA: cell wall-binding repeat-containing protein [Desulfosporosinus sp.]|nr:cell wall-binding repeat-containing protein [Desulfosporosinus sp.]
MKRKLTKLLVAMVIISGFYARIASAAPLALSTDRIGGADRVATAIAVSNKGWTTAKTVILSELNAYPDSLSATPLAKQLDAPILLTDGNILSPGVMTEIERLKPTNIIILGGEARVTRNLAINLEKRGLNCDRIGGADRYATSALIAKRITSDSVIIVNGENFPDALVSAPYAAIKQIPILLTQAQGIPASIREVYGQLKPTHVLVVGGTTVVPTSTLNKINFERINGVNRYDTAAKMYSYSKAAYSSSTGYIASGEKFPDAMVGASLAAKTGSPLFLTLGNSVPVRTTEVLSSATLQTICILGGTSVVSSDVCSTLEGKPPGLLGGEVIVLDPGHGSPDPGAVGPAGTREKDSNFAIAQKLASQLRAAGAVVYLTRNGDGSPASPYNKHEDLWSRVNIANSYDATLFVSIHSNAGAGAYGTETYYGMYPDFDNSSESYKLAKSIQDKLVNTIGLTDRGVKTGDFTVLNHFEMPAVLVEVAFISNAYEEQLLASDSFRQKAATGIYQGILAYTRL